MKTNNLKRIVKQKKQRESEMYAPIIQYLNYQPNTFAFRVNSTGVPFKDRFGNNRLRPSHSRGIPDILCCREGRFYAFEVKATKYNKPTPEQISYINRIKSANGKAYIIYSIQDVIDIIDNLTD